MEYWWGDCPNPNCVGELYGDEEGEHKKCFACGLTEIYGEVTLIETEEEA